MKIKIIENLKGLYLEESSGWSTILDLSPKGVTLYYYVSIESNLTLTEIGDRIEVEK